MEYLHEFAYSLTDAELKEICKPLENAGYCIPESVALQLISKAVRMQEQKKVDKNDTL